MVHGLNQRWFLVSLLAIIVVKQLDLSGSTGRGKLDSAAVENIRYQSVHTSSLSDTTKPKPRSRIDTNTAVGFMAFLDPIAPVPTSVPRSRPQSTAAPTSAPTATPTSADSDAPTSDSTVAPTPVPTPAPTAPTAPTPAPTPDPLAEEKSLLSQFSSEHPDAKPTPAPTEPPTADPAMGLYRSDNMEDTIPDIILKPEVADSDPDTAALAFMSQYLAERAEIELAVTRETPTVAPPPDPDAFELEAVQEAQDTSAIELMASLDLSVQEADKLRKQIHTKAKRAKEGGMPRSVTEVRVTESTGERLLEACVPPDQRAVPPGHRRKYANELRLVKGWPLPRPRVDPSDGYLGLVQHALLKGKGKMGGVAASQQGNWTRVETSFLESAVEWTNCAVVGASGTLLKTRFGAHIDNHATVVRINQSPAGGQYAPFVGNNTHLRLLNHRWTIEYADSRHVAKHDLPLEGKIGLLSTERNYDYYSSLHNAMRRRRPDVSLMRLNPLWIKAAGDMLALYRRCMKANDKEYYGGKTPSLGFVAVYTLMHVCDRLTVYGFGNKGHGYFGFKGSGVRMWPNLYYEGHGADLKPGKGHEFAPEHALGLEQALLKALAMEGRFAMCGIMGCRRGPKSGYDLEGIDEAI